MKKFQICLVSAEVTPFAKTGGLADVTAGLGRYLGSVGHDVRIFMPLYPRVRKQAHELAPSAELKDVEISFGKKNYQFSVLTNPLSANGSVQIYFVDCPELYDRDDIYTSDEDEHIRFALLSRAAIEACQHMQWSPDVFHCNDWHAALLPIYLKTNYAWDKLFEKTKTMLTIHNIGYQGGFGSGVLEDLGLMAVRRHLAQDDLYEDRLNFLKTGLMHADVITTVSRTYAREIQTPELGMGLEKVLRERRGSLHGVVNGVDYGDWNPETDPLIPHNYTAEDMAGKERNKEALLKGFELDYEPRVPVLGVVSRLTGQKGFELLPDMLPIVLRNHDVRLVVLGSGENKHEQYFQWLRDTYPKKVAVFRGYNNELAHRIEAGADMFLMPSRYEPCGLNQMYSLKYGTVPIVRRTGGLADTVEQFDPATGKGTGFLFDEFRSDALHAALRAALSVWAMPTAWAQLVQNGMAQDFSWERQGKEYEALYGVMAAG